MKKDHIFLAAIILVMLSQLWVINKIQNLPSGPTGLDSVMHINRSLTRLHKDMKEYRENQRDTIKIIEKNKETRYENHITNIISLPTTDNDSIYRIDRARFDSLWQAGFFTTQP